MLKSFASDDWDFCGCISRVDWVEFFFSPLGNYCCLNALKIVVLDALRKWFAFFTMISNMSYSSEASCSGIKFCNFL